MSRWTIYDEIDDDLDALARIRQELRALNETDLTEAQIARLLAIALETNKLMVRAQVRQRRAFIK